MSHVHYPLTALCGCNVGDLGIKADSTVTQSVSNLIQV